MQAQSGEICIESLHCTVRRDSIKMHIQTPSLALSELQTSPVSERTRERANYSVTCPHSQNCG